MYTAANIGPLLVSGTNWIYFDAVNLGGPAGLIFSATINYSTSGMTVYTSDPNIADSTSGIGTYATFSNYTSGDVATQTFTPTSSELANNGFRVYGGTLNTGLDDTSNWIEATFSSPVSTITVFPNIDHFGSAYDGFQYKIAGSNDGINWTLLYDPTSVNPCVTNCNPDFPTEPFTLGSFTGTPPTTVNNVLTPGAGPGGTVGYAAQFTFSTPYQFFAFGASTAAINLANADQELSAVGTATLVQPISTSTPPNLTTTFSNTAGEVLSATLVYNTSVANIDFHGLVNPVLLTTNVPLSQLNTFPGYVSGLPIAGAPCTIKAANTGGTDLCSLIKRACYDQSAGPATATDFTCPSIDNPPTVNDYILTTETSDWGTGGKVTIDPGSTISMINFKPSTPEEQWTASPVVPNPACPQLAPYTPPGGTIIPAKCDLFDGFIDAYGDQTTTRSGNPKKAWTITLANVRTTQTTPEAEPAPGCPSPLKGTVALNNTESTVWVNAACKLGFLIHPATMPASANCQFSLAADPCNHWQAAPPLNLLYGQGTPAVEPGAIPGTQPMLTNPSPVCTAAGPCSPQNWETGGVTTFRNLFQQGDGSFPAFWLTKDTFGIAEKIVVLHPTLGDPTGFQCPDPTNVGSFFPEPCYTTAYPTVTVNLDSTPPMTSFTFTPPGAFYATNENVNGSFACTDPPANSVASGIATCTATVDSGTPFTTGGKLPATTGAHKVTVTAVDNAGNTTTQPYNYTVQPDAGVVIFEKRTSDYVKPGGTLTYADYVFDVSTTDAAQVTVTQVLQPLTGSVQFGAVKATVSIQTCSLAMALAGQMPPCSTTPAGGASCSTSGNTITCVITDLPSIRNGKAAVITTTIPVTANCKLSSTFKITATVSTPGNLSKQFLSTSDLITVTSTGE
jgi:hypothetical protein